MTVDEAREEFPIWAGLPVPVHIIEETEWRDMEKEQEQEWKWPLTVRFGPFWKKHMILILIACFLPLWTAAACLITGSIVRRNTEAEVAEELTHNWRGQMQIMQDRNNILESIIQKRDTGDVLTEEERSAFKEITGEGILAGEESRQAAMDAEADAIARLLYGYRNNSLRDRKTLIWCVLMRTDNAGYPGTVEGVVSQKDQWMFYSNENPIRTDDKAMALEQLQAWHDGRYPAGLSTEYVYAEWSQTRIRLFDNYEDLSERNYWRFPE